MFKEIDTGRIQYFAIAGSIFLFIFIIELIRRRKIKVAYSLLWLFFSVAFLILSFWRTAIDEIAQFMGIAYSPAAVLLILVMAIFLIMIQFSVIISKMSDQNKNLTQELGIIKELLQIKKQE